MDIGCDAIGVAAEQSGNYKWLNFPFLISFSVTKFSHIMGCPSVIKCSCGPE